jgi:chorismate synthase
LPDDAAVAKQRAIIRQAKIDKDTVGGIVEAHVFGCPPGVGSCMDGATSSTRASPTPSWASRRSRPSRSAGGGTCPHARARRCTIPDPLRRRDTLAGESGRCLGFVRDTNNAGGTEGGMTNGVQPVVVRGTMKPIATLLRGCPAWT